ncbi:hypothetical protein vseg_002912 [Gypsophila vaccaria]
MGDDKYILPSVDEAPWLIISDDENINQQSLEEQTFCTMSVSSKNKTYVKNIVELNGKDIIRSSLGWFILRERKEPTMYSLWNPVTLQSLHLPKLVDAPPDQWPRSSLTFPPYYEGDEANHECVLLLFFEGLVFICRPTAMGGCTWAKQSIQHDNESVVIVDTATVNGDIYAVSKKYILGDDGHYRRLIFRVTVPQDWDGSQSILFEPLLLEIPSERTNYPAHPTNCTYLVEASGVLHIVYMILRLHDNLKDFDIFKALVWRLDLPLMKCILVESLGNRAFLLGDCCSTWCWASTCRSNNNNTLKAGIEGDCIYMIGFESKCVHSYSLRDDYYACLLPHPNLHRSANSPTWFMPHIASRFMPREEENTEQNGENTRHIEEMKEDMDMTTMCGSILTRLPSDLVISVAERMNLLDELNLRLTCKTIRSTIPLHKWRDGRSSYPLFMSFKINQGLCQLWDPFENTSYTFETPYSPDDRITIEFCKDSWLLLRIGVDSLEYFNPFTKERKEYPSYDMMAGTTSHAFSTLPKNADCLTLGIMGHGYVVISLFQAGTEEWEDFGFIDADFWATCNSSPVWFNNSFYFIGVEGKLGVFTTRDEKWGWIRYDSPLTLEARESLNSCYLVELDGQLIAIFFQHDGRKVQVFQFAILVEAWVELKDLGEYAVFLSQPSSCSVVEKDGLKRNRIYLPKRMGNEIVYYSLDTCKYHALGKDESMDNFYGMITETFCCWI